MSALTLLSFLFFLNILQNCIQEHMDSMEGQVIVMSRRKAAREAEKRKGEDGILTNTTGMVEIDNKSESRIEEMDIRDESNLKMNSQNLNKKSDKDEQNKFGKKYYVKLLNKYPGGT